MQTKTKIKLIQDELPLIAQNTSELDQELLLDKIS